MHRRFVESREQQFAYLIIDYGFAERTITIEFTTLIRTALQSQRLDRWGLESLRLTGPKPPFLLSGGIQGGSANGA